MENYVHSTQWIMKCNYNTQIIQEHIWSQTTGNGSSIGAINCTANDRIIVLVLYKPVCHIYSNSIQLAASEYKIILHQTFYANTENAESIHNNVDIKWSYVNVIHMKSIGIDMHIIGIYMNTIYVALVDTHMIVEFTLAVICDVCLY